MYPLKSILRPLLLRPGTQVLLRKPLPLAHLSWAPTPPSTRSVVLSPRKNLVDEKVDEIAEQYTITKDEFEIAVEETEKRSIYAAGDRATVREELGKLETIFRDAVSSSPAEQSDEIERRVKQRIRELKNAVDELSKADFED